MNLFIRVCVLIGMCWSTSLWAQNFVEGKDYVRLNANPTTIPASQPNKITIYEFFSYGCPWCYKLEPAVEAWQTSKPKKVIFERVPVAFEQGWDVYSKAFYIAQALDLEHKLTPKIFNAIHKNNENVSNEEGLFKIFSAEGVNKKDFDSAFNLSNEINVKMNQANLLMQNYQVFEIPTFVVAGKYKTNLVLVKGDPAKLIAVLNFLVEKELNVKQATRN